MHLVAPLDKHFPLLYVLLKEHIADDVDYKVCSRVIVKMFFNGFTTTHYWTYLEVATSVDSNRTS